MKKSGFVDLQVNGFGGVNFSSISLSLADVRLVNQALVHRGTLAYCPTVVTSSMDVYEHTLPILAEAVHLPGTQNHILGIHLEGPFLSAEDGARGVHPHKHIQVPTRAVFDELYRLAGGQVSMLTLAPELPGSLEIIAHATNLGIAVSIGHTLADAQTIWAAIQAGARLSTHLGNGCPNLLHRHRNPIWPQLSAPGLTTMMISDGHHLPPEVLAVFLAAKGIDHLIITSDAAPVAGCPPGEYHLFGSRVLLETNGRLRNLDQDTLAGSSATMLECMNYFADLKLVNEEELWKIGRDNPLAVVGKSGLECSFHGNVLWNGQIFEVSSV